MIKNEAELRKSLLLYFVMGSQDVFYYDPLTTLEMALKAGVTSFQWREKGSESLKGNARLTFAQKARELCLRYDTPFFVDDDVALAVQLRADGVHVGQKDERAKRVREEIGDQMWLGVSVHSLEDAERALDDGADYIGVGPYKPTTSKRDAESVIGDTLIRHLTSKGYPLPIVAIGGITPGDVSSIRSAGVDGVAVISAISKSKDPVKAVHCFITQLQR